MAGGRKPGPICGDSDSICRHEGIVSRSTSPVTCVLWLCSSRSTSEAIPAWSWTEFLRWKILPKWMGGDKDLLRKYKDGWVRSHREAINSLSRQYDLPPVLLAGVAWIEVGGDPTEIDELAYSIRSFDHSADPFLEPITITTRPGETSTGAVSIQLRRAAEAMNLNFDQLTASQKDELFRCLDHADNNLGIVARHLWQLKNIDFPNTRNIGTMEISIIGARYNRGPQLSNARIRKNTSYGDFINRISTRLSLLLKDSDSVRTRP
jgi:hypothetical protein